MKCRICVKKARSPDGACTVVHCESGIPVPVKAAGKCPAPALKPCRVRGVRMPVTSSRLPLGEHSVPGPMVLPLGVSREQCLSGSLFGF